MQPTKNVTSIKNAAQIVRAAYVQKYRIAGKIERQLAANATRSVRVVIVIVGPLLAIVPLSIYIAGIF
jgi:hypothetical protein